MAKKEENIIETLKSRGLSCSRLSSLEKNKATDAKTFRSIGFNRLADREEQSMREIKDLRRKVCLLK